MNRVIRIALSVLPIALLAWWLQRRGRLPDLLPAQRPPDQPPAPLRQHIVVANDTLSAIALRYGYGEDWRRLAAFNNLANPHLLHIGDVIVLP